MKATSTNLSGKLIEMLLNTTAPLGVLCDIEGTHSNDMQNHRLQERVVMHGDASIVVR